VRVRDSGALGRFGWHAKCVVIASNAAYSPCEEQKFENGTFNALVVVGCEGMPIFIPSALPSHHPAPAAVIPLASNFSFCNQSFHPAPAPVAARSKDL
jgi:hypothetical protein